MMPTASAIIAATGIHHSYRVGGKEVPVLRGIDLEVEKGQVLSLCGPSGAGKTTLLYTLAGLERPDRGDVVIDGEPLYGQGDRRLSTRRNTEMGFLFQHFFLMPEFTALENVLLPAYIGQRDRAEAGRAMLDRVGLGDRLDHLPAELSGGEQQRVALARALVNNPAVVFADEPTGNLDSATGASIMDLVLRLAREGDTTLVIVTHDDALARLGDRVAHLEDGRIMG